MAKASASAPHSAKDKAFWYAIWTLDAVSYVAVALLVYFVATHFGRGPATAGGALCIGAMSFGSTRYGLWLLTRPGPTQVQLMRCVQPLTGQNSATSISSSLLLRWR